MILALALFALLVSVLLGMYAWRYWIPANYAFRNQTGGRLTDSRLWELWRAAQERVATQPIAMQRDPAVGFWPCVWEFVEALFYFQCPLPHMREDYDRGWAEPRLLPADKRARRLEPRGITVVAEPDLPLDALMAIDPIYIVRGEPTGAILHAGLVVNSWVERPGGTRTVVHVATSHLDNRLGQQCSVGHELEHVIVCRLGYDGRGGRR